MKRMFAVMLLLLCLGFSLDLHAQERRPIDSEHPMWLVHIDVWNKADPQKIIDLIPEKIKPYVVMNLSMSCSYDTARNVYKMPQSAIRTYKSWASVCQANGLWFTCQPASGGHTHIQDDDLETFEYFFKTYPNFLGWNYAEQFWGFDEPNDKSSSSDVTRIALFAKLVKMSHKYGGFLTISFCGNIWSHHLNPVGMMKRNNDLYRACQAYPEAILWLYKYTTSSCFYNNESVTFSPFVAGLAKNYGVRYDNCGWNGALEELLGKNNGKKYPIAAGIGTVMEQTCSNGGAVWDGPELIWTEDFQNLNNTTDANGFTVRNWGHFPGFTNAWLDMFEKIIDGQMYIPTREEVVGKTKIYIVNNVTTGDNENQYAAWGDLYDGLYKQTDPFNRGNGQWMNNLCYFKSSGRYGAIPVGLAPVDEIGKTIPVQINKSSRSTRWSSQTSKVSEFNRQYPSTYTGDMFVSRFRNQLVTYTPYTYMNSKKISSAQIPLLYNTCESMQLTWGKLSSALIQEHADYIDFYLNNYRSDTTTNVTDQIVIKGATTEPVATVSKRVSATCTSSQEWNAETGTFTLKVSHNGPVDVSIKASGAATNRATDVVAHTALEMPKQPEPYNGPIIIEAEDMKYMNIKSCVTDPYTWYPSVRGHSGNGFADMGTNTKGGIRWTCQHITKGQYDVTIRYTNTDKASRLKLGISSRAYYVDCPTTEFNEWKKVTLKDMTLQNGVNISIANSYGIDMYIDQIIVSPVGTEAEKFDVTLRSDENGTAQTERSAYAEGEVVQLYVEPKPGFALDGWKMVHGNVKISDDNTFVMPDEHVTLQPIFRDTTLVYQVEFTKSLGGAIPAGWRAIQENDEVHAYPNSYTSGARILAGFTGYDGKALYWRDNCAEYGRMNNYKLHLKPGQYVLKYAMAAWKSTPKYSANILTFENDVVASSGSLLASPNANGSNSANISRATEQTLKFTVTDESDYIIQFKNLDVISGYDEFLLAKCQLTIVPTVNGIDEMVHDGLLTEPTVIYGPDGRQRECLVPGINLVRQSDGRTVKMHIK